jgi:hypothetical protein
MLKDLSNVSTLAVESFGHTSLKVAPLLFSELDPEALVPSHTEGARH